MVSIPIDDRSLHPLVDRCSPCPLSFIEYHENWLSVLKHGPLAGHPSLLSLSRVLSRLQSRGADEEGDNSPSKGIGIPVMASRPLVANDKDGEDAEYGR